jgi:superfamily II DNA or RNA helicase
MGKQLRYYQKEADEAVKRELKNGVKNQLLVMATGCHAVNTPILMYNGEVKLVQDIEVGEQLMGPDSKPREVLQLARGKEIMYKIIPVKGESFIVNENHILSLKRTGKKRPGRNEPDYVNITVKDYLHKSKHFKHIYKLYRSSVISFNHKITTVNYPYFTGLWLGDGSFDSPLITKDEPELEEYFANNEFFGIKGRKNNFPNRTSNHSFTLGNTGNKKNPVLDHIRKFIVNNEKRIPCKYLTSLRSDRLQLLAGLLDTDGHLHDDGCSYEITTKYKGLADDILFLSRSLGLAAYCSEKTGKIKSLNFEGLYYRINISGNTDIIPCKIKRKIANARKQIKDVLVTGFTTEKLDVDDFYGFALDGDHLYLMGDFTVTHNTGKTMCSVNITSGFNKRLWLTHTEELISQSGFALLQEAFPNHDDKIRGIIDQYGDLTSYLKEVRKNPLFFDMADNEIIQKIGIIKAEMMDTSQDIIVASIQTIHRRLDGMPQDMFDCVIIDESHMAAAKTWEKTINHFQPKLTLGLTATPHRSDNLLLSNIFDKIVYEYSIQKGIQDGFLCELDGVRVKTAISLDGIRTTAGEFNQKDLQVLNCHERNQLIVDSHFKYADGRQAIAFCVDVEHAMDLCSAFKARGVNADFVVGDENLTTDRKGVIAAFKRGEIDVVTNCMVLTAGFDHPNVGAVHMACPTKSLTKYIQCVGRGSRLKAESYIQKFGQNCKILDYVDNSSRHSLINSFSLDKGKNIEDRIFVTKENKEKLLAEREKNYVKIAATSSVDTKINLFKLPEINISTSERMLEPATEKQLAWIERLGYDIKENQYTKAMCSEIINSQPATDKQIWALSKKGYDVTDGCTWVQAKKAFEDIEAREAEAKFKAQADRNNAGGLPSFDLF